MASLGVKGIAERDEGERGERSSEELSRRCLVLYLDSDISEPFVSGETIMCGDVWKAGDLSTGASIIGRSKLYCPESAAGGWTLGNVNT